MWQIVDSDAENVSKKTQKLCYVMYRKLIVKKQTIYNTTTHSKKIPILLFVRKKFEI